MRPIKISICTVCHNRLHHLEQTLAGNIRDIKGHADVEYLLLDYNSQDGMETWVKENFINEINAGQLVYYKNKEVDRWDPSHSKNIAFSLASGELVCNIWADLYIGQGFIEHLKQIFEANTPLVLTPIDLFRTRSNYYPPKDVLDKVCLRKTGFIAISGFDERMDKHGFEDYDLIYRLHRHGVPAALIINNDLLKYVSHEDMERYQLPTSTLNEGTFREIADACKAPKAQGLLWLNKWAIFCNQMTAELSELTFGPAFRNIANAISVQLGLDLQTTRSLLFMTKMVIRTASIRQTIKHPLTA